MICWMRARESSSAGAGSGPLAFANWTKGYLAGEQMQPSPVRRMMSRLPNQRHIPDAVPPVCRATLHKPRAGSRADNSAAS
jgi:hypothetical protein